MEVWDTGRKPVFKPVHAYLLYINNGLPNKDETLKTELFKYMTISMLN